MTTNETTLNTLIAVYSRELVNQVAPEENDVLDELLNGYFASPTPAKQTARSADDPLGFGLAETLAAATPAAAAIVSAVLTYVLTEVIRFAQDETVNALKAKIKKLFNSEEEADTAAALTKEQLKTIKEIAVKQGRDFGLSPAEARKMANALIGVLAIQ